MRPNPPAVGTDSQTGAATERPTEQPARAAERAGGVRRWQLIAAGAVALLALVLAAVALGRDAHRILATNNVPTNGVPVAIAPGNTLCREGVRTPAGSGGIRPHVVPTGSPDVTARLQALMRFPGAAPVRLSGSRTGPGPVVLELADTPTREAVGTVCFRNVSDVPAGFAGVSRLDATDSPLRVEGKRVPADISLDVVLPRESLLSAFERAAHRATIWGPSWVGDWTMYVVLAASLAMLALAVTLVVWRPRAPRRMAGLPADALAIAAIALCGGLGWAALLPPWQAPDEIEHFAYVQYLAENGDLPGHRRIPSAYSTEHGRAMEQSFTDTVRHNASAKPPWEDVARARWEELQQRTDPSPSDGGGISTASHYPPPYYGVAAAGYSAFRGGTIFDRLFGARLVAALLAALTVLCVWLFARELFGRGGVLANTAALSVALLPQFQFMAGITNNDSLLILMGSLELYLIARVIRRGPTPATAVAMGVVLAAGYLTKPTMVAFAPAVAAVLGWPLLRDRSLAAARLPLIGFAAFVGVWVIWGGIAALSGRELWPTEASGARSFVLGDFLNYLWSFYLPSPPGVADQFFAGQRPPLYTIWMHSFFAAFGWNDTLFPERVYEVITGICVLVAALLGVAAWRERAALRRALSIVAAGAVTTVALLVFVHLAFYLYFDGFPGEQGRYLLPLAPLFGAAVAASSLAAGRRLAPVLCTVYVTALGCFAAFSYGLAIVRFYT